MSSILMHIKNLNNVGSIWVELLTGLAASLNKPFPAEVDFSRSQRLS